MAHNPPFRGVAYEFYVSLVSQSNTKVFQSNPTLAAGDAKVSKDGAALANLATLPAAVASGKFVKVNLSATEMTADNVTVGFSDVAGAEWCDLTINIQTVNTSIPAAVVSIAAGAINAAAIADNAIDAGALATGAVDKIVDAVWDELQADHDDLSPMTMGGALATAAATIDVWDAQLGPYTTAGSAGKALSDAAAGGGGSSPAAIADAVWDEAVSGHSSPGSAGLSLVHADRGNKIGDSTTAAENLKKAFDGTGYSANLTVAATLNVTNHVLADLRKVGGASTGDYTAFVNLLKGTVPATVVAGTNSTTVISTGLTSAVNGFYVGKTLFVSGGARLGEGGRVVTAYDGATKRLTVSPALSGALTPGDTVVLVG